MNLDSFKSKIESQEILKGVVKIVQFDKTFKSDALFVDLQGVKGIILRKDVDAKRKWKTLTSFAGKEISFVIESIDEKNGVVFCSRAKAQELKMPEIVERLSEGEVFEGVITHFLRYGAFIDIEGVNGFLSNADFSYDTTAINEIHKVGDKIQVRLSKPVSENQKLYFEAVEKYHNPTIMNFDIFQEDQVIQGVIKDIKPFGVFVNIAPGLDALCNVPQTHEIEIGMNVVFRIQKVLPEQKRVRGKILRPLY